MIRRVSCRGRNDYANKMKKSEKTDRFSDISAKIMLKYMETIAIMSFFSNPKNFDPI